MIPGPTAPTLSNADNFNLNRLDIDGTHIGDSQNYFLPSMSANFPANASWAKRSLSSSVLYIKPISCQSVGNGVSRCEGKFAEMLNPVNGKQKVFVSYRGVVADVNQNSEPAFLSTSQRPATRTKRHASKGCRNTMSRLQAKQKNSQ